MLAPVTNLAEWRASHPPVLRLWQVQCQLASSWINLYTATWSALLPIPKNRG